jgi:hypothetical protein
MPLNPAAKDAIRAQLERVAKGEKPRPIDIGVLTPDQFAAINAYRSEHGLPALESAVVCYVGKHHYESRSLQGYSIEDMIAQLESGLSAHSEAVVGRSMTAIQNKQGRNDGHGKVVKDLVTFELTQRKPKAEALSVVPKGDGRPDGRKRRP